MTLGDRHVAVTSALARLLVALEDLAVQAKKEGKDDIAEEAIRAMHLANAAIKGVDHALAR